MTGEGIGQALDTGVLAAEAILRDGDEPATVARTYEREVRRSLGVDNALAALLPRALKHRKGARAAVRVAGLTPWTRRNFARWLFEDYPRALILTPSRWRRGVFTGPGAYRAACPPSACADGGPALRRHPPRLCRRRGPVCRPGRGDRARPRRRHLLHRP